MATIDASDEGIANALSAARAQNRNRNRITPPMPPDEMSSPFARPIGPTPHSVSRELLEASAQQPFKPKIVDKPAKAPSETKVNDHDKRRQKATQLITNLLEKWYVQAKRNPAQADRNLALELMLNGSFLIECAYPIDTLNNLINLKQRLLTSSENDDSGSDDAMTVHDWLTRKDEPKGEELEPETE